VSAVELDVIVAPESALEVFTAPEGIAPFLSLVRNQIDAFEPDVTTRKGREAIASMAYKVAKVKSYLDGVGKTLADEQKEIPKKIDAARKRVRDTLGTWQDEVRQPLTDWEDAENARIKQAKDWISATRGLLSITKLQAPVDIGDSLDALRAEPVLLARFQEFTGDAADAKALAVAHLERTLAEAIQREKDEAELARLRAEQAERAAQAEQQRIADEARARAEEAGRIAKEAAERREREANEQLARAESARIAAEERAAQAEQDARDKVAKEQAEALQRERKAQAAREADKEHRRRINRAAVEALVESGIAEVTAIQVVALIATGKVPAVSIRY